MKPVQAAHKKYSQKRLATDGQVQYCKQLSMKDPAKLDQEKLRIEREKLKSMEQDRDDAFDESVESHIDLFVRKRTAHLTDFCEIVQSFHHFYAEGYTLTHNMLDYLEKIKQKSKDSAEALKKTPIDRIRTFDPDGQSPSTPVSSTSSPSSISSPVLVSSSPSSFSAPDSPSSGPVIVSSVKKISTTTTTTTVTKTASNPSASKGPKPLFQTIALYDYDAQDDGELSFVAGDTICVTANDDPDGWWFGYLDRDSSKQGNFPSNYTKAGSGSGSTGGETANALYDYAAEDDGELSFSTGDKIVIMEKLDGGWWRGKNEATGAVGLFPSNFTDAAQ